MDIENTVINKLKNKIKCNDKIKIFKINSDDNNLISMEDSLKLNQVLLWGLNQVDSIILKKYEDEFIKSFKIHKKNYYSDNKELNHSEYDPKYNYYYNNLDFLNIEYERIENKLLNDKITDLEYEKLLDLQDKLTELIENLNSENSENSENSNHKIVKKINDKKMEIYNDSQIDSKIEKMISQKRGRKNKLKPYYWIGNIPDGYREASEEEAILNKKVSWFGKKKVSRELYNIYNITGALFIDNLKEKDINTKIIALKGKARFYKKEYEYNKITLTSRKLNEFDSNKLKEKIDDIKNSYLKTINILNLFVKKLENNKKIIKTITPI